MAEHPKSKAPTQVRKSNLWEQLYSVFFLMNFFLSCTKNVTVHALHSCKFSKSSLLSRSDQHDSLQCLLQTSEVLVHLHFVSYSQPADRPASLTSSLLLIQCTEPLLFSGYDMIICLCQCVRQISTLSHCHGNIMHRVSLKSRLCSIMPWRDHIGRFYQGFIRALNECQKLNLCTWT